MPDTVERWTAERVRALPDDGNRYELVAGELIVTPAPSYLHQAAVMAFYDRLRPWLAASGIGRVMVAPADLSFGQDEILQPDLFAFPTRADVPVQSWRDIGSLLLAVEVLSPATARYDRTLKRLRYQQAEVGEYWIVDVDARLVERWRPEDARPEIVTERLVWRPGAADGAEISIDLDELFAGVHGNSTESSSGA
ncbi:MAG: Uma2 family endonuclease [Gemmatimonadales bacterium]|nr:Uma2 family endonuclease [Gemmatimonadales bacterium]